MKYRSDSLSQKTAKKCIPLGQRSLNPALKKSIKYAQIVFALFYLEIKK